MRIEIHEICHFDATARAVWAELTNIDHMADFGGFGPIPGIRRARWVDGDEHRVGAVREIENTDGSTHREEVVAFEPGRKIQDRIFGFTSPFRFMVHEAIDTLELVPETAGTGLRRTFVFELRSISWWPVARLSLAFFRRAVRRHHIAIARRLES